MQRLAPVRAQDVDQLPRALEWFGALRPEIETAPLPGHDTLARALSRHGAVQTGFLDLLRGEAHNTAVQATQPQVHSGIEVVQVEAGDAMLFARTLLRGHVETYHEHEAEGLATMVCAENVHHYLARVDGQPAAAAILSLHDGIAYLANASALPDHRNRGCHSALIATRMRDAVAAGCDTVIGLAEVASTSHRNMERAGLHTLATIAAWTFPGD
jgi:ribosomal protein S18 acetylase RimI-like enzyme